MTIGRVEAILVDARDRNDPWPQARMIDFTSSGIAGDSATIAPMFEVRAGPAVQAVTNPRCKGVVDPRVTHGAGNADPTSVSLPLTFSTVP